MDAIVKQSYFEKLNEINNSNMGRGITVKKDGKVICNLDVNLSTSKPLISVPSKAVLDQTILFDVVTSIGKYKEYSFGELTKLELPKQNTPDLNVPLEQKEIEEYKATRKTYDGKSVLEERYIPYVTIFSPAIKTDITIFIDILTCDMFFISGLEYILDSSIKVDPKVLINVTGYKLGGKPVSPSAAITPSNNFSLDTQSYSELYGLMSTVKDDLLAEDPDVKAYGVVFSKELPRQTTTNNFPILYDKVIGRDQKEVQIARQDGYPSIIIQIGKVGKFFKKGTPDDQKKLYNWVLYGSTPTRIMAMDNGLWCDKDTILSTVISLF